MLKATIFIAAAFALSAQSAMAGPLGGAMSASETGEKADKSGEKSLLSSAMDQLKFSFATFRVNAGGSTGKPTEYKSTPTEQCDGDEQPADEEKSSKAKKDEPSGPEPIYFGF